jgi:hypothetical protein
VDVPRNSFERIASDARIDLSFFACDLDMLDISNLKVAASDGGWDMPAADSVVHAHGLLVTRLAVVPPNRIGGGEASEADLLARATHLMDVARIVDAYILALGHDVKDNTSQAIDLADFTDQLTGALEGNATYQLARASQRLRDARMPSGRWKRLP